MKVEKLEVLGLDWAFAAMRQPFMGKGKTDDIELAKTLINNGREERKFLRQVTIQAKVSGALCWWAEADTYKVGVTRNSQSFWNSWKGEFTLDDFVRPYWMKLPSERGFESSTELYWINIIQLLNSLVSDGCPKEQLRYLVPQGINYTSILTMTGEAYLNMLHQRCNHRLEEWILYLEQSMYLIHNSDKRLFDILMPFVKKDSKLFSRMNSK